MSVRCAFVTLLVCTLSACAPAPLDLPAGTSSHRDLTTPTPGEAGREPTTGGSAVHGEEVNRFITDCLARFGLSERPVVPDETTDPEARMRAQRLRDEYDARFTDCSAVALATASSGAAP
ncbi:hypothetical protein [Rathayibacter toxicus]|uniref:hypothetical protein n=1 Tax=Rathayibacter toxicus TaxID=145458 RepID=UPI0011B0D24A|nr:hypothetical protein [Rathayibacter toxicus]QOD10827.1 hypothetical protein BSG36_02310 [Rathayibacter toxicus]